MRNRLIIPTLAATGALETGYLSFARLSNLPNKELLCFQGQQCGDVLASPYATLPLTNIPLTAVGCVAYLSIAVLSTIYLVNNNRSEKSDNEMLPKMILAGTMSMAAFSGYLMTILSFVLQQQCTYCYISAALTLAMAITAWSNGAIRNKTEAFVLSASSVSVTTLASTLLFYFTSLSLSATPADASTAPAAQAIALMEQNEKGQMKAPPKVKKHSSEQAMKISERLQALDAKMFGAYWCSHCYNQKQTLGLEAIAKLPYVECDKEGFESQYPLCKEKKVPGYPTWEIKGNLYPGEKDLDELEKLLDKIEK